MQDEQEGGIAQTLDIDHENPRYTEVRDSHLLRQCLNNALYSYNLARANMAGATPSTAVGGGGADTSDSVLAGMGGGRSGGGGGGGGDTTAGVGGGGGGGDVSGGPLKLIFFTDAMHHIVRLCRILRLSSGHALLIGEHGHGKSSVAQLAAHVVSVWGCDGGPRTGQPWPRTKPDSHPSREWGVKARHNTDPTHHLAPHRSSD